MDHPASKERSTAVQEGLSAYIQFLLKRLPAVVWTTDQALKVTSLSGAGISRLRVEPERLIGQVLLEHFPAGHPAVEAHRRALCGESSEYEADWLGRIYDVQVEPLRNGAGETIGAAGVGRDVTEHRLMERAIHIAAPRVWPATGEAFFPLLVEALATALRADCAFVAELLGGNRARTIAVWREGRREPNFEYALAPCVSSGSESLCFCGDGIQGRSPRHDLLRQWGVKSCTGARLLDGSGATLGILAVMERQPMSEPAAKQAILQVFALRASAELERLRSEAALRASAERLRQAHDELQEFAYVASHDLREPLRNIAAFADLLAKRYRGRLDTDADEFIGYMVEGAQRMDRLLEALLSYSRISTRMKPFVLTDCNALLADLLTDMRSRIEHAGAIVRWEQLPTVRADAPQLRTVFEKLLDNALKFNHSNPPTVHISTAKRDNEWTFVVRDNGIGIPPDHHERIFRVFQRLHPREKYSGIGVGLSICKKIIERHGGRIWVESREGSGTGIHFTLPVSP